MRGIVDVRKMTSASVLVIDVSTLLDLRRSRCAGLSYENGGRGRFPKTEAEVVFSNFSNSVTLSPDGQ
jgi:hypothetical protein